MSFISDSDKRGSAFRVLREGDLVILGVRVPGRHNEQHSPMTAEKAKHLGAAFKQGALRAARLAIVFKFKRGPDAVVSINKQDLLFLADALHQTALAIIIEQSIRGTTNERAS